MATTFVDRETVITASWLNAADTVVSNAFIIELSGITDTVSRNAYFTAAINVFTASASGAVPASGGGTENFLRADGAWAAPAVPPTVNFVINGGMTVGRRTTAVLSTSFQYGTIDRFRMAATGGTPSAGSIARTDTANIGRSKNALRLNQATISGSGVVTFETHIEARDAAKLVGTTASLGILCWHNVGSAKLVTVTLATANAADDFTAVTAIGSSTAQSVPSSTETLVTYEGITMGNCGNGIRIRVAIACGAITLKDFEFTELILSEGATVQDFPHQLYASETLKCARYFQKTFPEDVEPVQGGGYVGSFSYTAYANDVAPYSLNWAFVPQMMVDPTVVLFNPAGNNAKWFNNTLAADSGIGDTSFAPSRSSVGLYNPQVSGDVAGNVISVHATADADFNY